MLSSICNKQVVPIITPLYSGSMEVIISTEVVTDVDDGIEVSTEEVDVVKAVRVSKIIR